MQSSRAVRCASRSRTAVYSGATSRHSILTATTGTAVSSSSSELYSQALIASRRQRLFFSAVRSLHQTHCLLKTQKAPPPSQPKSSSASSEVLSSSETSSEKKIPEVTQKSLSARAKELWATAKYLFKFYFNGVKQIWANRTRVKEVEARVRAGGKALTRDEFQLLRTHRADMKKLPLFLFILLILEEALPLVVIWAPSLLPSTCVLPSQLVKIRMGDEVKRAEAYQQLQEASAVQSVLPVVKHGSGALQLSDVHSTPGADPLAALSSRQLGQLAKMFQLSTWGGAAMVRRRLDTHMAYIREDDGRMSADDYWRLLPQHADDLAKACAERGLRATGVEQRDLSESLRTWLLYTTSNPATRTLSNASAALLPLQLYNPASLQHIRSSLEAENQRGLIDKTNDVFKEVVEEEKKVLGRDEKTAQETVHKQKKLAAPSIKADRRP